MDGRMSVPEKIPNSPPKDSFSPHYEEVLDELGLHSAAHLRI